MCSGARGGLGHGRHDAADAAGDFRGDLLRGLYVGCDLVRQRLVLEISRFLRAAGSACVNCHRRSEAAAERQPGSERPGGILVSKRAKPFWLRRFDFSFQLPVKTVEKSFLVRSCRSDLGHRRSPDCDR